MRGGTSCAMSNGKRKGLDQQVRKRAHAPGSDVAKAHRRTSSGDGASAYDQKGVKYDEGKLDYSLVDPVAHAEFVAVLTYGAIKYAERGACTCGLLSNDANAGRRSTVQSNAGVATTNASRKRILPSRSDNKKTQKPGVKSIQSESLNIGSGETKRSGRTQFSSVNEKRNITDRHMGSPLKKRNSSSVVGVPFAVRSNVSGSITTTKRDSSVGASVTTATSALDSSNARGDGTKKHSPTCGVHSWNTGAGNWRKVPNARERYYAAALRHLEAWRADWIADDESGLHHLAHAMCCLHFLLAGSTIGANERVAREARHQRAFARARVLRANKALENKSP